MRRRASPDVEAHERTQLIATPVAARSATLVAVPLAAAPVAPSGGSAYIHISLTALGLVAGSIAGSVVRTSARGTGRLLGGVTSSVIEGVGSLSRFAPGGGGHVGTAVRFSCQAGSAVAAAAIESSSEAIGEAVGIGASCVVALLVSGVGAAVVAATNVAIAALPPAGTQDGCSSPSPWADGGVDPPTLLVEILPDGSVREHRELPEQHAFYPSSGAREPTPSAPTASSFEDPSDEFCIVPRTPRMLPARYVLIPPKLPLLDIDKQSSDSGGSET